MTRDAKLIALGERLEEIQERLRPVRAEHRRLAEEAHAYAYRRTGWEPDPASPPQPELSELCERYLAAYTEMGGRNGYDRCEAKLARNMQQVQGFCMSVEQACVSNSIA
jgi:hypothetical protein